MIESLLVVLARSKPDRDDELNDWYDNIHLRDAMRFRGGIAAQRFVRSEEQPGRLPADWPWRYLALYEVYDAARFSQEHREAADTVRMQICDAFGGSALSYYFPLAWRTSDARTPHDGGVILEFLNPASGRDAEFHAFCERRLAEAGSRPGVHSAAFLTWRDHAQMIPGDPAHRYVAVYWTTDDAEAARAWAKDDALSASELVDQETTMVVRWNVLTRRIARDDVLHGTAADMAAEERARATFKKRTGQSSRATLGVD